MDLLTAMSVFRRVAEAGSFSAIARETGLSQPTVSRLVASLEERLGIKLINRSTRRLNLTEGGRDYYERCIRILDELAETEASLRNRQSAPTGTLRVNAPATFGRLRVVPQLWGFMERYPDIRVDLLMDDRYVDLVKEGVDLAIRIGPLGDSSLVARKLGESPRMTVASPAYLAARGEPEAVQDLKHHDCIVYTLLSTRNQWHFTGPSGREIIRVGGRFSTNNPGAVRAAVLAGAGIAVTPRWLVADCLAEGRLTTVLRKYRPTPLAVHAIYPQRRFVPASVRLFIDHLAEQWGECI